MTNTTRGPSDGLVEPRNPIDPPIRLEDPRVPPWRDLIAAERRRLRQTNNSKLGQAFAKELLAGLRAKTGSNSGSGATGTPQAQPLPAAAGRPWGAGQSPVSKMIGSWTSVEPTNHTYRYTKAPDLTNDEMGYGERVDEELWFNEGGKIVSKWRSSQRTKSGRQFLFQGNEKPKPSVIRNEAGGKQSNKL